MNPLHRLGSPLDPDEFARPIVLKALPVEGQTDVGITHADNLWQSAHRLVERLIGWVCHNPPTTRVLDQNLIPDLNIFDSNLGHGSPEIWNDCLAADVDSNALVLI